MCKLMLEVKFCNFAKVFSKSYNSSKNKSFKIGRMELVQKKFDLT